MKLLHDGPEQARSHLLLAHGAGVGMDSPFMDAIAEGLAARHIAVDRFEFPYMQRWRQSGKRTAPDSAQVLMDSFRQAIATATADPSRLVLAGKSMGGRIASMLADEMGAKGLVCLGYPFHPSGKPQRTRVEHLRELRTPALIIQGTRDTMGNPADVAGYELAGGIRIEWIEDGDHSLAPRKRSGSTPEEALAQAVASIERFVGQL